MIEFAWGVLIAVPVMLVAGMGVAIHLRLGWAMTLPFFGLGLVVFHVTIMRGQVVAASARVAGTGTGFDEIAPVYAAAIVLLAVGAAALQVVDWCRPSPPDPEASYPECFISPMTVTDSLDCPSGGGFRRL